MTAEDLKSLLLVGEKIDLEFKKSESSVPRSVYESYSAFANTNGGIIVLGVKEDRTKPRDERFIIQGIANPEKQREDFWNTINSSKVSANILRDEDVTIIESNGSRLLVIRVPRADYKNRPVYVGENPFKGTYRRNHDGDYHASADEVRCMLRDQNDGGNDSRILEYLTMEDIDTPTLQNYRRMFQNLNPNHVWNALGDQEFLEVLGGYRRDRKTGVGGITLAGLMMFGKGLAIRDEFDNIFMDYRDESRKNSDIRWEDRITYDGTWENNLFNFFMRVTPKLTENLKKPFLLEGYQRIDDTPVHKAVREAFVNLIIHADYLVDSGILKVIKEPQGFSFTNPGILKLPVEDIFRGGNSKTRNPRMQTMFRLVGFGDNAGSGFPSILSVWKSYGWPQPALIEDTVLNQVTLKLSMMNDDERKGESLVDKSAETSAESAETSAESAETSAESAETSADSAETSADSADRQEIDFASLPKRHKAILQVMNSGEEYSAEEIGERIGLKGSRTRQLLKELVDLDLIGMTAATRKRRYFKGSGK